MSLKKVFKSIKVQYSMKVESLKVGNKIVIEGKTYDVVSIQNDATVEEDGSNELFVAFYLHELGNKHIKPTHMLANYFEKEKITFVYLLEDKDEVEINPRLVRLVQ